MADLAWHWTSGSLRNGDPVPKDGEWLHFDGEPKMCERGLHASRRVIDALQYAPGPVVHRVAVKNICDENENDKLVAKSRLILWRHELPDKLMRAFARQAALSVIDLWDAPDVVRKYLENGDEELRAAAGAAAWAAAWAAAGAAAWAAAWAAAGDAKFENFNTLLEKQIREAAGSPNDKKLLRATA